ncbi:MAG: hypothetical protein GY926_12230 [bacterium]|nr:hypothetical protein [bacterium]MCP4965989.1 hypothetical protein [bacterium]
MSAEGLWLLDYDWEVDGTSETITIEFRSDNTYTFGDGSSGDWAEIDGLIVMKYEDGPYPVFAAVRVGDALVGLGTTGGGYNMTWRGRRVPMAAASSGGPQNEAVAVARFLASE